MSEDQETLIARYLEGRAREDEVKRLDEWLRAEPDARRQLIRAAQQDVGLRRMYASEAGATSMAGTVAARRRWVPVFVVSAAAGVLLAAFGMTALRHRSADRLVLREPATSEKQVPRFVAPSRPLPRSAPLPSPPAAIVEATSGQVFIYAAGMPTAPRPGDALTVDDVVDVGPGAARAVVREPDGTKLTMSNNSVALGFARQPILLRGSATVSVPAGLAFAMSTPQLRAQVTAPAAAQFTLTVTDRATRIRVTEGHVTIASALQAATELGPGETRKLGGDPEPSAAPALPARVTNGQLVLYTFREGEGAVVHDVSGAGPALDLQIGNLSGVKWSPSGLQVLGPTIIASQAPATKVTDAIVWTQELAVEAWITPAEVQAKSCKKFERGCPKVGAGRIVTISSDELLRDFTLGQSDPPYPGSAFTFRLRTTTTDTNGWPPVATPADAAVEGRLTHLVYTRDASGLSRFFIDGVASSQKRFGGDLSSWQRDFRLGLANELTGDRPWLGTYHLIAVYDRALSAGEIARNYKAQRR
jgi:hypothetical protein